MQIGQVLCCRVEPEVIGGTSESLFVKASGLLKETDYQKSLRYVASRKNMANYQSMMDFLFCELVVGYRRKCQRFYNDEGPPLHEEFGDRPEQIALWDTFLVASLHIARQAMERDLEISWAKFRQLALPHLQQAA